MKQTFTFFLLFISNFFTAYAQDNNGAVESGNGKILITVNGGFGYRIGKIADEAEGIERQYLKNMKSGYTYEAGIFYMFNTRTGVGLKYNAFKSSESLPEVEVIAPNGEYGYSAVSDDLTISFYGASVIHNLINGNGKHKAFLEAGVGYSHYNDDAFIMGKYKITGGNITGTTSINYQYMINNNFSVGPKLSVNWGTIGELDVTGPNGYSATARTDDDDTESLYRLDIGVQLMYRF